MPQLFTLYPDLTAHENVDFVASLFGMLFRRRRRRTREVLELVDLWEARDRRAGELSGGMQRRLELACALVHEPALLFLDEPTAGIDPLLRTRIWEELHRLRAEGRTLLVTTQYVGEAELCDIVALIADGRLVAFGTPGRPAPRRDRRRRRRVETASAVRRRVARRASGVVSIKQLGPRHLSSSSTMPRRRAAGRRLDHERGGEVASARESPDVRRGLRRARRAGPRGARRADRRRGGGMMKGLIAVPSAPGVRRQGARRGVRRPGALASLILGPFLIMALFGPGYSGYRGPLKTVIVVPPDEPACRPTSRSTGARRRRPGVTDVERTGRRRRRGWPAVDVVVVAPADAEETSGPANSRRSRSWSTSSTRSRTTPRSSPRPRPRSTGIIERIAEEGQTYALEAGARAAAIPPAVVAAPTRAGS